MSEKKIISWTSITKRDSEDNSILSVEVTVEYAPTWWQKLFGLRGEVRNYYKPYGANFWMDEWNEIVPESEVRKVAQET